MMPPVVKLREGADFTFGAWWALVQYHPWKQRGKFLEMGDDEVRDYFRWWVDSASCPWYAKDQYYSENVRNLRVPPPQAAKPKDTSSAVAAGQGREMATAIAASDEPKRSKAVDGDALRLCSTSK